MATDPKKEKEFKDVPQQPEAAETVTLTIDHISSIVNNAITQAVDRALASVPQAQQVGMPAALAAQAGAAPPPGQPRRLTNRDFEMQNMGIGRQTQEDVVALATSVGPVTHKHGFLPFPPEDVAEKDFEEHRMLINRIESFGYVVSLDRVEFRVRYEPTKIEIRGERQVKIAVDPKTIPEPPDAQSIIAQLLNADPRFSRIWIQKWVNKKPITGDRLLDDLAAEDVHQSMLASQRVAELARAEIAITPYGEGLGYLKNLCQGRVATIA